MGIEIPAEYGGAQASFTTAIIAIEELAKVDPSVSVMADVHVHSLFFLPTKFIRIHWSTLLLSNMARNR